MWMLNLQFSDGFSLQIRVELISEFFGDRLSIFAPSRLFTDKKWKQMWIVFVRIPGILTGILGSVRYMYIIYYDILITLELQVYFPSKDNFYSCLSMLSSIPGRDDKIKFYGWSRILLSFPKRWFLWIGVSRCEELKSIEAFYPRERYTFPFALCSNVIQISHDFINKYVSSAFYSEWCYSVLPIIFSP